MNDDFKALAATCERRRTLLLLGGGIPLALFVGLMIAAADHAETTSLPPSIYPTYTPRSPIDDLRLDYNWKKGGFGSVMLVDFSIHNYNEFAVKDLTVRCEHSGNSGTKIDSNTRTIYNRIAAHNTMNISEFNMGFIDNQAVSTSCKITDFSRA